MEGQDVLLDALFNLGPVGVLGALFWRWFVKRDEQAVEREERREQQSLERESRLATRINQLEERMNTEVMTALQRSTEAIVANTEMLERFSRHLDRANEGVS